MLVRNSSDGTDANSSGGSRRAFQTPMVISVGNAWDVSRGPFPSWAETAAVAATTTAVIPYVQAIAGELGRRTGKAISCRLHFKGKGGKALVKSAEITLSNADATTTIELTGELPDEARLMLLDLDLNSSEVRGKILRWDVDLGEWKASNPAKTHRRRFSWNSARRNRPA